jgi:hypothetical protein
MKVIQVEDHVHKELKKQALNADMSLKDYMEKVALYLKDNKNKK